MYRTYNTHDTNIVYSTAVATTARPTEDINCCCNKEVQEYREFSIRWITTKIGDTAVSDCKGHGLTGIMQPYKTML